MGRLTPNAPAVPHYVYVIELDDAVGPRVNAQYPSVYVGQSYLLPEERFKQHIAGYKAARVVKKYGRWLRRGLYARYNPISGRKEAERIERDLAARLRGKGYTVYGGH